MAALCIGGVCIPYSAIVPAVFLFFRWFAAKIGLLSVSDDAIVKNKSCCSDSATAATLKPRRSKLGKSMSTISNASSTGTGTDGTVKEIESSDEWAAALGDSARPIVVKFTAGWCKPCQAIDPFYKSLAKTYDATFVKVDVDELDDVAGKYEVAMMPTFVILSKGEVAGRISGAHEGKLEALIQEHCPTRVRI